MVDLGTLAQYQFEGKPEQAVREEWLAPLLLHLGYGGETLNTVIYAESIGLAAPFRRIGRQRVEVDYRPTVLGHGLWIIEAKAHKGDEWEDAISQAWLYATHPEIDVPFMVVADGSRIAVYDVYKPDWGNPVADIATRDLVERFPMLAEVVGAANVTRAVRERRMRHLGAAMRAELDPERLDEYVAGVTLLAQEARSDVLDNRGAVLRDQLKREETARADLVRRYGLFTVGVFANQPLALNFESARLGIEHVRSLPREGRVPELGQLVDAAVHRGGINGSAEPRMFWMLRVTALEIYLSLRDDDGCGEQATSLARQAICDHLLNFPDNPTARAAHRLEKVMPTYILRSLLTPEGVDLGQIAREAQQNWGDEARLRARLDGDRLLVDVVTRVSQTVGNAMPWREAPINNAAQILEDALPTIGYRKDGARGPAGDPFLDGLLRIDDLLSATLDQTARHFSSDLFDEDMVAALDRLGEADYDCDDRFIKDPAKALVARLRAS